MQPQQLLTLVNTRHDTTFELVERYPRGENGAFAVVILNLGAPHSFSCFA